jgi:hypothetical protein
MIVSPRPFLTARFSLTAWPNYPGESGTRWDSKCDEVYRDNGNVELPQVVTPVNSFARLFLVLVFDCIHRASLPGYVGLPANGADVYAATGT